MSRTEAREIAFKIIFQYAFQTEAAAGLLALAFPEGDFGEQKEYIEQLIGAAQENLAQIDALIGTYSEDWAVSRLSKATLAALRCGIAERNYMDEIPESVAINEAVELAKRYEDEKAGAFVNGILSSISKAPDGAQ
jgi:N utilization substance protein B